MKFLIGVVCGFAICYVALYLKNNPIKKQKPIEQDVELQRARAASIVTEYLNVLVSYSEEIIQQKFLSPTDEKELNVIIQNTIDEYTAHQEFDQSDRSLFYSMEIYSNQLVYALTKVYHDNEDIMEELKYIYNTTINNNIDSTAVASEVLTSAATVKNLPNTSFDMKDSLNNFYDV